jgi:hypothetical protein
MKKFWFVYSRNTNQRKSFLDFWDTEEAAQKSADAWYCHYVDQGETNIETWHDGPYTPNKRGGL